MRLAYRTLRVLSTEWTDELHRATSELAVNAYDRDLDSVTRYDVRIAADILARSKYFTLVLDEDPQAVCPPRSRTPGKAPKSACSVPRIPLASGSGISQPEGRCSGCVPMPRASSCRWASGSFAIRSTLAAEQRQVNGCQLALDVRAKLSPGE